MFRKYGLPVMAVVGMAAVVWAVNRQAQPITSAPAMVSPAVNPFGESVSGAGIVEPESENIAVAPALGGIVTEVYVKWGQQVQAGDNLYQVDARPMKAQLVAAEADVAVKEAAVKQAMAALDRLREGSRAEDKKIAAARVDLAKVQERDALDQWDRIKHVTESRSFSEDEVNRRRFAFLQGEANRTLEEASAEKVKAGGWDRDIEVQDMAVKAAAAEAVAARARVETLRVDLDRLTVRAPVAGKVLRINVRRGEFTAAAGVGTASDGAVVLGDVDHLNVRVDIDESDVTRFRKEAAATGFVRGATRQPVKLEFVRVEPFVVPKRNLTGSNTERVDTRVLQVIYRLGQDGGRTVYVGQQMDVYVDGAR